MLARLIMCVAASFGVLAAGASTARAEEPDCRFFKVGADALNVFKEPRGASDFIARLAKNDIVCVGRNLQAGGVDWVYIVYQLAKQNRKNAMAGWAIMRSLQPATPEEIAAVRGAPAPQPFSTADGPAPAPAPIPAPAPAPAPAGDVVRFSEPITSGPLPVNGHSLEELIKGVPLFPPIEGLDEGVWKKPCGACHKWDRKTLCAQGAVYAKDPKAEMRVPHPYGGPEKVAIAKWFRGGCQ
jgi:hypothetical protein